VIIIIIIHLCNIRYNNIIYTVHTNCGYFPHNYVSPIDRASMKVNYISASVNIRKKHFNNRPDQRCAVSENVQPITVKHFRVLFSALFYCIFHGEQG